MTKIRLSEIAQARSGDKGDGSNVGVFVATPEHFELIKRELTTERVKQHFAGICKGEVVRYELPNRTREARVVGGFCQLWRQSLFVGQIDEVRPQVSGRNEHHQG